MESLRDQVAYLRGVIAVRDQELASRAEELRRRDAALEREQQLTAMFDERLRILQPPTQEPAEAPEMPPEASAPRDAGGEAQEATQRPR